MFLFAVSLGINSKGDPIRVRIVLVSITDFVRGALLLFYFFEQGANESFFAVDFFVWHYPRDEKPEMYCLSILNLLV